MIIWLILTYAFIFASLRKSSRNKNVMEPLILAFLFLNILIFLSTGLLSMPHALNAMNIQLMWAISALLSGTAWLLLPPRNGSSYAVKMPSTLLALGVVWICLILLIKTVFSAPFSNDVLIYHLPRVMHWIQNQTAAPYPTHILRQLFNPPLAAYFQLHLYLLSGGDHLSNFPQYLSMLLSLCGVSLISSLLGLTKMENCAAVFLAAYLPSGILIAPTGSNDYSVSLWVIGFVIYVLKYIEKKEITDLMLAIAFLSLISLTKINALFLLVPFIVFLTASNPPKSVLLLLPVLLIVSMVPLNTITSNDVFSPLAQLSFVHPQWGLLENIFRHLITQSSFFMADEENSTNPLHTILMVSFLIFFLLNKNRLSPLIRKYSLLLLLGTFLSFMLIKASIWTGRFHLPAYLLFCPLISLLISRSKNLFLPSLLVVFICGTCIVLFFSNKPLLGPKGILHIPRHLQIITYDKPSSLFLGAAEDAGHSGCSQVGLIYRGTIYQREYIIWQTFKKTKTKFRLEHVDVHNASGSLDYPLGTFTPCAVIQAAAGNFTNTIQVQNNTLKLYKQYNPFVGLYFSDKRHF